MDLGLKRRFYGFDPKGKGSKGKNKWMGLIRLKSFRTAKETANNQLNQPTEREKNCENSSSNWGLISKIYKEPK